MEKKYKIEIEVTVGQNVKKLAKDWNMPESEVALGEELFDHFLNNLKIHLESGYDCNDFDNWDRYSGDPKNVGFYFTGKVISRSPIVV